MALNNFAINLDSLDEGRWFTVGGMRFLTKGMTKELSKGLQKAYKEKKITDQLNKINDFVFNKLVIGWEDVTEEKLQSFIVSDATHKESEWFDICDIKFHIKRFTLLDAENVSDCTNDDAKQRKTISKILIDWEDFKVNDDDKECIPFSKKIASEFFMNEKYRSVYKMLRDQSESFDDYLEKPSHEEIKYNKDNIEKYFINCDRNEIANDLIKLSNDDELYKEEQVNKDIEKIKK